MNRSGGKILFVFLSLLGGAFWLSLTGSACITHFSYDASANPATEVFLSGTFNNWASAPPDVWQLTDDDHDQIWELTADLPIDTYLYKFIVDGVWIHDPANPEVDPDGFGGYNSVLSVACDEPEFTVDSYYLNEQAGALRHPCRSHPEKPAPIWTPIPFRFPWIMSLCRPRPGWSRETMFRSMFPGYPREFMIFA